MDFSFYFLFAKFTRSFMRKQIQKSKGDYNMLSEKIERFVKNFNELKGLSIKYLMDEDMLKSMSSEDLKFIQLTFGMLNDSLEIMKEQARLLEAMNDTLELLASRPTVES